MPQTLTRLALDERYPGALPGGDAALNPPGSRFDWGQTEPGGQLSVSRDFTLVLRAAARVWEVAGVI